VRGAERPEERRVGERQGEVGERVRDVVGWRGGGARGGEERRGTGEADAAARRGRQRVRCRVARAAGTQWRRRRRARWRRVAVGLHEEGRAKEITVAEVFTKCCNNQRSHT